MGAADQQAQAMAVPKHPVAQMQGAFEESMRETLNELGSNIKNPYLNADKVQRRRLLLESPKYERTVGGRWIQRRGENFHPLWKLVAQISFGMHLLQSGLAKSDEDVINILQTHVDEVDGFLERTTDDFELAQHDVNERVRYLRLPLEHGDVFDTMLVDKAFRAAIVDGNEKIEHIVNRTTSAIKDALKDVQKGLDGTRELERFLRDLNRRWPSKTDEHEAVYAAMVGNSEGWKGAFKGIQQRGSELGNSLVHLGGVISEIQRRVGIASRRNLPAQRQSISSSSHSRQPTPGASLSSKPSSNAQSKRVSIAPVSAPTSVPPTIPLPAPPSTSHARAPSNSTPSAAKSAITDAYQQRELDMRDSDKEFHSSQRPMSTVNIKSIPLSSKPSAASANNTQNTRGFGPAELPGDSRPNPRMSLHAMMTMEALSKSSNSEATSKKSSVLAAVEDENETADENSLAQKTGWETAGHFDSFSEKEIVPEAHEMGDSRSIAETKSENEQATTAQDATGETTTPGARAVFDIVPTAAQPTSPYRDSGNASSDKYDPIARLHEEIIDSFEKSKLGDPDSVTATPTTAVATASKSGQEEGQTFFGYASSEADTGSVDTRSTPNKNRSRSGSMSQNGKPSGTKPAALTDQALMEHDHTGEIADEDGLVNTKHPLLQDIRAREIVSGEPLGTSTGQNGQSLSVRASSESLSAEARKNSFLELSSNSGAKSGSGSGSGSPLEDDQRDSALSSSTTTAGRPPNIQTGLRVRDPNSLPSSRPRTQVGRAPPIAPHPIQTTGLHLKKKSGAGGADGPPSPDLAELTSATVSGPDMGDPFTPFTPSSAAARHKHQELFERINGALQENANKNASKNASMTAISPGKQQGRTSGMRSHKKSSSDYQHTLQTPTVATTTTTTGLGTPGAMTTTTTMTTTNAGNAMISTAPGQTSAAYLGQNQQGSSAMTPTGNDAFGQQTTAGAQGMLSAAGPGAPSASGGSQHGRTRTLSPFGPMSSSGRDRTPDRDSAPPNAVEKKSLRKLFSRRGKNQSVDQS